ncbi:DEAD/DEAH box helicase [Aeromicrobium sp.]|uniref:DEAD/DEAH box helicase n=1 Tax=Aeromicrobium sp. TaxID=1871063 RepID=UPI0035166EBA
MATRTQQRNPQKARQNGSGARRKKHDDDTGLMPVLAKAVREVENAVQRRRVTASTRATFQAVGLLVREERARVKTDPELTEPQRADQLKRLDGVATILAKTATREPALLMLLTDDAEISSSTLALKRELMAAAGLELAAEPPAATTELRVDRSVVPRSVVARQLANPFMPPEFSPEPPPRTGPSRLATWELIGPLLSSFERAAAGAPACMELPEPLPLNHRGPELMRHQAQLVSSAAEGHRTFLLADEPGLGKTAQSLLAAHAAQAYPLLVVVPNVVKANWAREVGLWTPQRAVTVVHGNGDDIDAFADIVVVNYEILDRHAGWLGDLGFRGMVLDEAHFIKNTSSQRSRHVLRIADRIRSRTARPLMMALTGTPLINDVEDFRAIWQFLGWIDEKKPLHELMHRLDETGLTPLDPGFFPAARQAVIDMGIVRRRKIDVAADIPARRIADMPVELDGEAGRSIRAAEAELARRLVARYDRAAAARVEAGHPVAEVLDLDLVRKVAAWEREEANESTGENVFSMVRRIGQAKAGLAADYTAQLARSVGKVVFFAKHLDVMDAAQKAFEERGIGYSTIRGDQTAAARAKAIDAFQNDPGTQIIVCSLTAAGVGINLQVASNVVLAELSWTDAEQMQAIDRVHRIGQEEPVTAWRIIASQTIDTRIVELIDSKAGLAARALDGEDTEVDVTDVQLEALVGILSDSLRSRRR